jgi:hypothetical protein
MQTTLTERLPHADTCACSPCLNARHSARCAVDLPEGACWGRKVDTPHADTFEHSLAALVARAEIVSARATVVRAARMLCASGQHDAADLLIRDIRKLSESDGLHRNSAPMLPRTIDPVLCDSSQTREALAD